jgi:hypothetical protein
MESSVEDEGRPFAVGLQRQTANHLKRLTLRVAVVSVGGKVDMSRQVWIRKDELS